ncbi:hypothetical protein C8F01DRAFT_1148642 [Mycena amicta]|nr:hypothetical protein C8F01DRAFT_1148642 [Mycena amicta]
MWASFGGRRACYSVILAVSVKPSAIGHHNRCSSHSQSFASTRFPATRCQHHLHPPRRPDARTIHFVSVPVLAVHRRYHGKLRGVSRFPPLPLDLLDSTVKIQKLDQSAPDSTDTSIVVVHRCSSSQASDDSIELRPLDLPPQSSLLSSWNMLCRHSTTSGEPKHFGEGLIAWEDWVGRM